MGLRRLTVTAADDRAFVFRYVAEDGVVGLFVPAPDAPPVGEPVEVGVGARTLRGVVGWRNGDGSDAPGAGVVLEEADDEVVDHLIEHVRSIAYLPRVDEA